MVLMSSPIALSSHWRTRAKLFRDHAEESVARVYEKCATELDEALQEQDERLLGIQEAAELSGYSTDHLGRLVREEKIQNAGRAGAPRIRIKDLPRKTSEVLPAADNFDHLPSATAIVQSVIKKGA